MILYLFLYSILLLGAYVSRRSPFILYVVLFMMSCIIGFRGEEVGSDTIAYQSMYETLGQDGYMGYPEPLYGMLCVWGYSLGISFALFQTLLIFPLLCMVAYVIRKQSPNYCLSMFFLISLYFFFYSMNIFRQLLACYIMVLALFFLFEDTGRNKTKFLLLLIIATGIHGASLFLLSALFIKKINFSGNLICMSILASLLIGIFDIIGFLYPLLGIYENNLADYNRSVAKLILASFLAVYWILAFYFMYKRSSEDFQNSMYMKLFFLGIVVNNLLLRQEMGLRLMLFFTLPLIIGIPIFVSHSKNILMNQAIVIAYSSIYFFVFILTNSADVVPYYTSE